MPIKRRLHEFRVTPDAMLPVGTEVTAAHFVPGQYVDIRGAAQPCTYFHRHLPAVLAHVCLGSCLVADMHANVAMDGEECRALSGTVLDSHRLLFCD